MHTVCKSITNRIQYESKFGYTHRTVSIRVAFVLNSVCILTPFGMHSGLTRYAFGICQKFGLDSECIRNALGIAIPNSPRLHTECVQNPFRFETKFLTVLTAKIQFLWSEMYTEQSECKPNAYRIYTECIPNAYRLQSEFSSFLNPLRIFHAAPEIRATFRIDYELHELVQNATRTPRIGARMKTECKQNGFRVAFGFRFGCVCPGY